MICGRTTGMLPRAELQEMSRPPVTTPRLCLPQAGKCCERKRHYARYSPFRAEACVGVRLPPPSQVGRSQRTHFTRSAGAVKAPLIVFLRKPPLRRFLAYGRRSRPIPHVLPGAVIAERDLSAAPFDWEKRGLVFDPVAARTLPLSVCFHDQNHAQSCLPRQPEYAPSPLPVPRARAA